MPETALTSNAVLHEIIQPNELRPGSVRDVLALFAERLGVSAIGEAAWEESGERLMVCGHDLFWTRGDLTAEEVVKGVPRKSLQSACAAGERMNAFSISTPVSSPATLGVHLIKQYVVLASARGPSSGSLRTEDAHACLEDGQRFWTVYAETKLLWGQGAPPQLTIDTSICRQLWDFVTKRNRYVKKDWSGPDASMTARLVDETIVAGFRGEAAFKIEDRAERRRSLEDRTAITYGAASDRGTPRILKRPSLSRLSLSFGRSLASFRPREYSDDIQKEMKQLQAENDKLRHQLDKAIRLMDAATRSPSIPKDGALPSLPGELRGEVIAVCGEHAICWVQVAPGVRVKTRIPGEAIKHDACSPGSEFLWVDGEIRPLVSKGTDSEQQVEFESLNREFEMDLRHRELLTDENG